ncbi:NAD(P)-binding protein [Plenodomus tracheiphilus IPT5]|uniref:NAD(P)-binding protein n=1 Tax=Plenodomus tracheiphilus IPT5 TaxID=1408161 RepID=A0A6A7B2P3_9PLEO|nr:NAD(P)-binding protein [Plenodomus tracheiphilus IPT5]
MSSFTISDTDLNDIRGQVVVITDASSGIGLATLRLILHHGGKVFASDLNPLPPYLTSTSFFATNVTSWLSQVALFRAAEKRYGHIDHVFANAGSRPSCSLLEEDLDENSDLQTPDPATYDVNLVGVMYAVKVGLWYLNKNPRSGSPLSIPPSNIQTRPPRPPSRPTLPALPSPLRINAIAPSWTDTGILTPDVLAALGRGNYQSADAVARSVVVLMADQMRRGKMVYSERGRFMDLEDGERGVSWVVRGVVDEGRKEGELEG